MFSGGQIALVLSLIESLIGGRTAGSRPERLSASGERLCGYYGRSAPVKEAASWGDADAWAAKLFSINRMRTLLAFTNWLV